MTEGETLAIERGPSRNGGWREATDDELVAASPEDLDAFAELIRRHQSFVYGAALRIVRNPAIAEDLSQETFIRAFRGLGTFRGDAQLRSWLYRIATNLAKNAVTRSRETPTDFIAEPIQERGPSHAVESFQLSEDIRAAVDRLPDHLKGPFVMREFEHLSYKEIAAATGLGLNTVRTRIFRARRALRDELEDWR